MDAETLKLCKEMGLKAKEAIEFYKESKERDRIAQKESEEREAARAAAEATRAAAEAEKVRAEAEKVRAEAEKVRQFELKKIELQIQLGVSSSTNILNEPKVKAPKLNPFIDGNDNQNNFRVENFELAPFIDGKDDIYHYIENFEYYAKINNWNLNNWGMYLAILLTGEALGIYARMPRHEAHDYYKLKRALLPKFDSAENKCHLTREKRNINDKDNLEIELVKSKHEIVVSPSTFGSESFQQIISSQKSPTKGEDSFPQPETFAEKELPSSRDMLFLPALCVWERNEDEISSLYKTFAEQDEEEENLVTSDVIKRTEKALFSKELSNRSLISHKVHIEKNNEKEIECSRTQIPEWGKVDIQEAKKEGFSTQINISSETESQIGQPRMGMSEFESESEVKCNMFDRKSTIEGKEEGHEPDLAVTTSRNHFSGNEKRIFKKTHLECEKDSQSYSSQDKHNSEDLDKGPEVNQDDDILNQQGVKSKKKFDIHVSPKFGEDHIDAYIKETVKFQVEENKLFNPRSEEENKHKINQSYSVTPSKEINIFKISRELEPEPKSKIKSKAFNEKAIVEKKREEYKYALHIAKMKHGSSCHEQKAVKLIQLNCEKEFCIESLHTESQSLPDIQMDSLISLLQDEETEVESGNYLILPSPLSHSSFSPNEDLTNEVERKKRMKSKLCERKGKRNGNNDPDKRNNLNCKRVTRIIGKSSIFQIQQTKLYKCKRKLIKIDERKILECKRGAEVITIKRVIWIQQRRLYKYRRKGKVMRR